MHRLVLIVVSLLAATSTSAVELCGVDPNIGNFIKSGFEASELPPIPDVPLPAPSTRLAIAVEGPLSGSNVDARTVQIFGTFTGPPNTAVLINDVPAYKVGTQWLAEIELTAGTNALTVKALSMAGNEV